MENEVNFSSMSAEEAIRKKKELVRKSLAKKESELTKNGVLLTAERKVIVDLPFTDLLQRLRDGRLKALDTLKAFQAKALEEHKKTNCITEFVPNAEKWAKERDATSTQKRKALHGLPVSVKENFDIQGMDTTLGLTKRLGKPASEDAVLVSILLKQGAIPFVKTNVPQIIYSVGCSNPIYGATKNPHDTKRSPGGSSGGEAALITGGGSVLGLGTDMCGSVRIPATFCGTFGIKPTQRRISREGSYGTYINMIGVANASGLLGRDVDALAAGMEAVLLDGYMSKLDPLIPDIPWRKNLYESKTRLKIGWFEQDDFFPVSPGCKRAIRVAKEALTKRGHELILFSPPSLEELYDFGFNILCSEGGGAMLKHWEGEIVDDEAKMSKRLLSASSFVKFCTEKYLLMWSTRLSKMASQQATRSSDLWKAMEHQKLYTDKLFTSWKNNEIDVLLGPAFPLPAPHPSQHGNLMPACIYFAFYNIVDLPSGTMPVTFENEDDQSKLDEYPSDDYVFQCIKETARGALGLPLSVQIGALPWQEETILYAMKELHLGLETTDESSKKALFQRKERLKRNVKSKP